MWLATTTTVGDDRIARETIMWKPMTCLFTPAQAQRARTYVSSLGNDANDCNRLAASFGNAITYGTNSVSGNGAANSTAGWTVINRQ